MLTDDARITDIVASTKLEKGLRAMLKEWVIFYTGDIELLRYSLRGEGEGEREATIGLLAYERGIPEEEICWDVEVR